MFVAFRLTKMSSKKSQDMENISSLEEQLKHEIALKEKAELQLREHRTQVSKLLVNY